MTKVEIRTITGALVEAYEVATRLELKPLEWRWYARWEVYSEWRKRGKHVKAKLIEKYWQTGKRVRR